MPVDISTGQLPNASQNRYHLSRLHLSESSFQSLWPVSLPGSFKVCGRSVCRVLAKYVASQFVGFLQSLWPVSLPGSCKVFAGQLAMYLQSLCSVSLAGSCKVCGRLICQALAKFVVGQFARLLQSLWPVSLPSSCKVCGRSVCQVLAKSFAGQLAMYLQSLCSVSLAGSCKVRGRSVSQQFAQLLWYPKFRLNIAYADIPSKWSLLFMTYICKNIYFRIIVFERNL
jgi:hypothetical protein